MLLVVKKSISDITGQIKRTIVFNVLFEGLFYQIDYCFNQIVWQCGIQIKIKLRSFKSSEHINEKGDGE